MARLTRQLLAVLSIIAAVPAAATAARPSPVRVAHLPTLAHAPVLVARERGIFEAALAPRRVEWTLFPAGPAVIEALFAGEVDLAYIGPGPAVNGFVRSRGKALRVISGVARGGAGLVARRGSGLTDPAKLGGRRIATPQLGNTQDLALRHWLRDHGLKPADTGGTVTIVPLPAGDQLTLFQRGQLDGAWAVEPWLTRLMREGPGELILDEAVLWPDSSYATTVLVAVPALLDRDPSLVETWLRTQEEIMSWMAAHPDSARRLTNQALEAHTGKKLGEQTISTAWRRMRFDSELARSSIETGARWAAELGFLGRDPIDIAPMFHTGPLDAVHRSGR